MLMILINTRAHLKNNLWPIFGIFRLQNLKISSKEPAIFPPFSDFSLEKSAKMAYSYF